MWKLICERNPGLVHYLSVGKDYNIGRRDCEILIPEDMSISRKHAVIKIIHPDGNLAFPERKSVLHFKDISKLGTQLKDGRIANGEERTLNDGDLLVFGTAGISRYHAIYDPLVVTTSCLMPGSKKEVRRNVLKLGGHVVNEWCLECQLVIMSNLSVTIKVICALVSLKPIVTSQYLEDLVKAVEDGSTKLPNAGDYLPSLSESQVSSADVSFSPDPRRQTLFSGKTFVFLSPSQFKKLHLGLELGGAKTKLITDADDVEALAAADGVCIMMPDAGGSQAAGSWIQSIQSVLTRIKRRMIAESEIGFAVLYCSTATQCNPSMELAGPTCGLPGQSLSQNPLQSASEVPGSASGQSQSTIKRTQVAASLNQSSTFRTPLPPVQIKEEPVSQSAVEQQSSRIKKRAREESGSGDSTTGIFAALAEESTPSKKFRAVANKEITESSDRTRGSKSFLSGADKITVSEIRTLGRSEQLNPVGTTTAVSDCKDKLNLAESLMRYSVPEDTAGSLDMQFSIGSCAEPVSKVAEVKIEVDSRSTDGTREAANQKVDVGGRCQSSSNVVGQKASGAQTKKLFSKREDCKTSVSFLENDSSKENIHIQPGYLTAALPIRLTADPEFIKVEELPSKLVVTEVKSLLARRPGQQRPKQTASEAEVIWKGRPIKNFKNFRKVHNLISGGLPRIIGGKDLVVHESIPTADREDWFRNELEAESQRNNSELLSQELNRWQPMSRKR